jgi:hypothetical protein
MIKVFTIIREIGSVQTTAPGKQLRHPSPEPSHLALTQRN